ncbi:MAG TPA: hypothetical protein VF692_15705 [Pyrinomonadaceae bacterium]
MVKQENTKIASEINKLNENESLAVLDYISTLLTKRSSRSKTNQSNDDLILSLSDAYENKRARQVFEWERVRRQNAQRGA